MSTEAPVQSITSTARIDPVPSQPVDKWGRAEAVAKIASLIAIPVVLAIVGWLVQDKLATRTVSKDYVQLAVSILSQPMHAGVDPSLRSWAVELLNNNSPIKFSTEIAAQLRSGGATLPQEQSENLRALARSYMSTGDYARAEAALQETLALQQKQFGVDHPSIADSLANLGTLYLAIGRYNEAEAMYRRALAIMDKSLGPEHPNIARLLSGLASIYDAQGDFKQAQALRHRADAIYRHTAPRQ